MLAVQNEYLIPPMVVLDMGKYLKWQKIKPYSNVIVL